MKSQRNQVIALVFLIITWAVCWRLFIKLPHNQANVAKEAVAKAVQSDNLLRIRFRKVRSEMDALYHYRTKPTPFDSKWNPFRIPAGLEGSADSGAPTLIPLTKVATTETPPYGPMAPDFAETLLKSAVSIMRIGGVVTLNGTTQLTVDGQLHKEGDVFSEKVPTTKSQIKSILIRVKHLSTYSVTLALEDSDSGGAEIRIRLN